MDDTKKIATPDTKKSKFVELVTAYTHPELYGDISKLFVDYTPAASGVMIGPMEEVAVGFVQTVNFTNPKLSWHPWVRSTSDGHEVYFVAEQLTKSIMFGRDVNGWKNVTQTAGLIAHALGNPKLRAKGVCFTRALYEDMPEKYIPKDGHCLVLHDYNSEVIENYQFDFLRDGQLEDMTKFYSEKGLCNKAVSFLHIVKVPNNIQVKVGSETRNGKTPETSLRIKLPKAK